VFSNHKRKQYAKYYEEKAKKDTLYYSVRSFRSGVTRKKKRNKKKKEKTKSKTINYAGSTEKLPTLARRRRQISRRPPIRDSMRRDLMEVT